MAYVEEYDLSMICATVRRDNFKNFIRNHAVYLKFLLSERQI